MSVAGEANPIIIVSLDMTETLVTKNFQSNVKSYIYQEDIMVLVVKVRDLSKSKYGTIKPLVLEFFSYVFFSSFHIFS